VNPAVRGRTIARPDQLKGPRSGGAGQEQGGIKGPAPGSRSAVPVQAVDSDVGGPQGWTWDRAARRTERQGRAGEGVALDLGDRRLPGLVPGFGIVRCAWAAVMQS